MVRRIGLVTVWVLLSGCAASIGTPGLDLGENEGKKLERKLVGARSSAGLNSFKIAGKKAQVEWFACGKQGASGTALLINPDNSVFDGKFCRDWHAQTFLSAGLSVVGVNRPGFGKSEPEQDFSGPTSVKAIETALQGAAKKLDWFSGDVTGVWGFQSAVIAAAFWGKSTDNLSWMILGNGIYDLEEFRAASKSKGYLRMIQDAQAGSDASEFNEYRSIAWDTSGLPKKIQLYHGKQNSVVPVSQSASFRDTLAAEEILVKLEEIPKSGHEFKPDRHRLILEAMLKRLLPAAG